MNNPYEQATLSPFVPEDRARALAAQELEPRHREAARLVEVANTARMRRSGAHFRVTPSRSPYPGSKSDGSYLK